MHLRIKPHLIAISPLLLVFVACAPASLVPNSNQSTQIVDFDFSSIKITYQPPAPSYPTEAKEAGIEGDVIVVIQVDPKGIPLKATAESGPKELRKTAEKYSLDWRFEPVIYKGVPQTVSFKLTFPFRLKNKRPGTK